MPNIFGINMPGHYRVAAAGQSVPVDHGFMTYDVSWFQPLIFLNDIHSNCSQWSGLDAQWKDQTVRGWLQAHSGPYFYGTRSSRVGQVEGTMFYSGFRPPPQPADGYFVSPAMAVEGLVNAPGNALFRSQLVQAIDRYCAGQANLAHLKATIRR